MRLHSLRELDSSEGTVQLHARQTHARLILHPRPNYHDPNDPLTWPKWKKYTCFSSVCAFAFLTNYAIGGLAPAFYPLSIEFHKSMTETSELLIWPILVLGLFNFFWVPLANFFGKRPIFVISTLLLTVCYLWGALARTFRSLLWSNIIAAFAGSASEALAASIVNDVFFLHERANLMGWYMNAICGGNTIGPLICGFVITGSTWRIHKWCAFGATALNFLAVLLLVPETRYDRTFLTEESISNSLNESLAACTPGSDQIKKAQPSAAASTLDPRYDAEKASHDLAVSATHSTHRTPSTPILKKTYIQELSLWSGLPKDTTLLKVFLRPLPMIAYPAVIFSFLGFAVSLAWVVAINILNSFILQAPPYNWTPDVNGLINIPGLLGNLIGAFIGGWVVDRYSDWKSKHNSGVFLPETRLHLLVIPTLIVPAGCLVFGYGVARTLHWTALFFGNGMVSLGLTAVPTMTMTYVSDSYLPVNEDALTVVIGLKNVVAFGFLYGVVPWVEKVGYIESFGAQAGIFVAIMALAIPLVIWGPVIRHRSAAWRIIM
ncbi:hypothetical protein AC578_3002 [Pseudocercospora eumusae]|uniref:Major facilitator superfamily (MFS) profile domain-containing protein n=1 Tax=Pseudocercospora eumusae TaxID=321146 RepID=A0A139H1R6_9PEZI|nr:hypothetical protein AC578_3002 [Pseudocercospora eumusae]